MSQLQALVPGMNINQVHRFNLNFGSPRDANSAPTQAIRARNISSASSHEPKVIFYKNFILIDVIKLEYNLWCHFILINFIIK